MSIVKIKETEKDGVKDVMAELMRVSVDKDGNPTDEISDYMESEEELAVSSLILKHFSLGSQNQYTPRVEFNDLSLVNRDQYDQMLFNTYQTNNGESFDGSPQTAWRSRALRPIVRNKCMSIAAHATARLIFPKIFAYNNDSDEQREAARLIEDLMEWSGEISQYAYVALMRVITALASPASIGYTEYGEVMRTVKTERGEDGKWMQKEVRDEAYPCFMDSVVPVTQFYIQNIFQPDLQKQGWVIWRKVYSFSEAQSKYAHYDKFKYVRPGVQTIYDDANRTFYYVYDPNMRQDDVEEIMYWNKTLDLKIIMVNRVMLTPHDNPNPRNDKLYPFDKFFYEPINDHFFYGKSLAFKLQQDANVINTLYQMIIDKTYLSIFPPMVGVADEAIASDVYVPGAVTTLASGQNVDLRAINPGNVNALKDGIEAMSLVEKSINESSQEPLQQGISEGGDGTTAFEISRLESNANTVLGLFLQMIAKHVRDFGALRLGDILQYLTVPEVVEIEGSDDPEVVYKTFFINSKGPDGKNKKIVLDGDMPDTMDSDEYLGASYDLLDEENDKDMTIARANPSLVRQLKYMITISADVLNPRSTDLERAFALEDFDRMIAAPQVFNQEEAAKLLLTHNPLTKKNPKKYLVKQPAPGMLPPSPMGGGMPNAGNGPLGALAGKGTVSPMQSTPATPSLSGVGV